MVWMLAQPSALPLRSWSNQQRSVSAIFPPERTRAQMIQPAAGHRTNVRATHAGATLRTTTKHVRLTAKLGWLPFVRDNAHSPLDFLAESVG